MTVINDEVEIKITDETLTNHKTPTLAGKNIQKVAVLPIMNGPIFPGMIAPILLSEEKFTSHFEDFLMSSGLVALNLIKVKDEEEEEDAESEGRRLKNRKKNARKNFAGKIKLKPRARPVEAPANPQNSEEVKETKETKKGSSKGETSKKGKRLSHDRGEDERKELVGSKISSSTSLYEVGVICKVLKKIKLPDGSVNILVQGLHRYRASSYIQEKPYLIAVPKILDDVVEDDQELDAYTRSVINQVKKLSEINPYFNEEMKLAIINSPSPGTLSDLVAFSLSLDIPEIQDFLETLNVKKRFAKLLLYLKREKEVTDLQKKITDKVNDKVSKYQKEYFLREQMKVIKNELGMEDDDKAKDLKKIKQGILDAKMPAETEKIVLEEFDKLESLSEMGPEYNNTRTYLNLVIQLPWNQSSEEKIDIAQSKKILNRDHFGLEKAKERIMEFLAVKKLTPQFDGTILCFLGPPGVGKTSLGKSIAEALNRKFYRISLGGMRDEAEIKGHRRTYIGAMPGKIVQALKRVEVNNPVIMLDEIDKLGASFQGDPASALLEVLDPEQNSKFFDHYLDVPFDLSKVLFIATANYGEGIPGPLFDRMETIELTGYSLEEKVEIAEQWIMPKLIKKHGLKQQDLFVSKLLLKKIVADFAREPGVRVLEQFLAKLCRRVALMKVEKKNFKRFILEEKDFDSIFGVPRFRTERPDKLLDAGVIVGLAWTAYGGDILLIESLPLIGKGLKITGQIGEVMSESVNLAYSYVKKLLQNELIIEEEANKKPQKKSSHKTVAKNSKNTKKQKVLPATHRLDNGDEEDEGEQISQRPLDFLANHEIHIHLPAGAVPKDGPSAGITIALALYGLAHNKKIRSSLAMTGELSLTGKVLPIGGLKEKVLAAKRVGIKEIIYPYDNLKDLNEVPIQHRQGIQFYPVKHFKEVLNVALKS